MNVYDSVVRGTQASRLILIEGEKMNNNKYNLTIQIHVYMYN